MNSRIQGKLNEIKRLSADTKGRYIDSSGTRKDSTDGLSAAIHSKKDADTFMTELKAIRKRSK